MSISTWRPYATADEPQVEELSRLTYGDAHDFAEEWRHLAHTQSIQPQGRFVRRGSDGAVPGYAGIYTQPWMLQVSTRRLDILPITDSAVREEALDLLEPLCRQHSVARVQVRVLESLTDAVQFLGERGYRTKEAVWDLALDVEAAPLPEAVPADEARGYSIRSLATLIEHRPTVLSELHALWVHVASDQPGYDPSSTPPLDKFIGWMQSLGSLSSGILIAHTDEVLIGLTLLVPRQGNPGSLTQNVTGVVRDWRRRGVARALKLEGLRYARSIGASKIVTGNSPDNEPILGLNLNAGFIPVAKWLTLEAALDRPTHYPGLCTAVITALMRDFIRAVPSLDTL